jgi:hypothetical protein
MNQAEGIEPIGESNPLEKHSEINLSHYNLDKKNDVQRLANLLSTHANNPQMIMQIAAQLMKLAQEMI